MRKTNQFYWDCKASVQINYEMEEVEAEGESLPNDEQIVEETKVRRVFSALLAHWGCN